jgi:PEP-CTERM motif
MVTSSKSSAASAWAGAGLVAALVGGLPGLAQATDISFTVNGTVTSPNPTLGYTSGSAVSFTWVLDGAAVGQARHSGPGTSCCGGTLAWYQDFFSTTPHLWRSITGTGLTGAWQPPAEADTSDVFLSAGTFPQPYSASFGIQAQNIGGGLSGLRVNGLNVTGVQMNAVYLGLDAVGALGTAGVFSVPPPDATTLFAAVAGTYAVDRIFSDFGSIWANGPGGGQFTFRIDTLTIATVVPEPGTWALWLAGGGAVLGVARRQRATAGGVATLPAAP